MYKIIGADGKAYGPVTPEQIRQWISEARVNSETQVLVEGSQEWKPLSDYPEFADLLGSNAPAAPSIPGYQPPGASREKALQDVKGPAIGILVTAALGIAAILFNTLKIIVAGGSSLTFSGTKIPMWAFLFGNVFALAIYGIISVGAVKMMRLQNHQLAFATAILAMLPCSACCIISLPFGIWALVVLNRPDIKSQFS